MSVSSYSASPFITINSPPFCVFGHVGLRMTSHTQPRIVIQTKRVCFQLNRFKDVCSKIELQDSHRTNTTTYIAS